MKNNRKNQKLNFIRIKNKLRKGFIKFYSIGKTNHQNQIDEESVINIAKKSLLKEYKLSLPKCKITLGYNDDDFIKDLISYRIELYLN